MSGSVPEVFKSAFITPRLKKSNMDPADIKSYRPISNLPVASKLLERLVAQQLLRHVNRFGLLPRFQSAYRAYHSTETAVLKVLTDILLVIDSGDLCLEWCFTGSSHIWLVGASMFQLDLLHHLRR